MRLTAVTRLSGSSLILHMRVLSCNQVLVVSMRVVVELNTAVRDAAAMDGVV